MSLAGSLPVGVCTGWVGSYAESVDFGAEFLAQNRAFGDTVLSVDPDTPVPTCPGWTAKQLFRHVGRGNRWAAQMVAEHATEPADPASVPDGRPPADLDGDTLTSRLVLNRNKTEVMCVAHDNADGRWLVNPMFIDPKRQSAGYACASKGHAAPPGWERRPRPAGSGVLRSGPCRRT